MGKVDKAALWARLDRLGKEWGALGAGDEGARQAKQAEIFCAVFELYPDCADEIGSVFLEDWPKFAPEKGSLSGFFARRLRWRGSDTGRRDRDERRVTEIDPVTGEKKRVYRSAIVQEAEPAGEEGSATSAQDQQQVEIWREEGGNATEDLFWAGEDVLEALSTMLNLHSRLSGRANNSDRQSYFRMFFTDNVAYCLHRSGAPALFRRRERDLFRTLELDFLDYFMAERCRTVPAIQRSEVKPYGRLVEGRPMEETRLPLPRDVFLAYLERERGKKVKNTALSNQEKAYHEFMKLCLT